MSTVKIRVSPDMADKVKASDLADNMSSKQMLLADVFQDSDPYQFPADVKVDFEDIFRDPEGYPPVGLGKWLSPFINKVFGTVYGVVQTGIYYLLAVLVGLFLAIVWALVMGINNFVIVWLVKPSLKIAFQWIRIAAMVVRAALRPILDPLYESIGKMFSMIRATIQLRLPELASNGMLEEVVNTVSGGRRRLENRDDGKFNLP